jgi:lysophospholipid acyltransferase (LPLAT)-like uncharacterized protein
MMGVVTFIASLFIRVLHATLRVRHVRVRNLESLPQYILAFWHGHLLMMVKCRFRRPISVLISQSKDGELIARTVGHFGVQSVRGSSTRGGISAMRELLRVSRSGANLVFTPDGPKGPYHVASDGVVYAAQMTGLPIVPIAFTAKKKSSWARGIACSCRTHSHAPSFSTASRSPSSGAPTSRKPEWAWSARSIRSPTRLSANSISCGRRMKDEG